MGIVTILEGGEFIKGFQTECGGINRGDIPRLIPTHEVRKTL